VIAGTGRRYLRIGVESLDDVLCGVVDVARFGIAAVVQVNADDGIVVSEYEPDTISVFRLGVFECCLEGIPRLGSVDDANPPVPGVTGTFVGLPSRFFPASTPTARVRVTSPAPETASGGSYSILFLPMSTQ